MLEIAKNQPIPLEPSPVWQDIRRGQRKRPGEWIVEKLILLISMSAILMVFLIFAFVTREALPVFFGRMNNSHNLKVLAPEEAARLSRPDLARYLEVSEAKLAEMDPETVQALLEIKVETAKEAPADKDADLNTTAWRYLVGPQQWSGYAQPEFIWQPVSAVPKYNIIPLLVGSLKTTLVALMFSVPLALAAAIYVSQLAPRRWKEILKPAIEMLAGIPSVVLGFFALIAMASFLQGIFGYQSRLNALVAGIALGLAVVPVVFSISEDALTSVPRSFTHAALALGSSRWQAAWRVVLPAALPGVFAAIVLGFGRAVGETMVVLMASGNASIMSWSLLDSTRTITATIAAELAETVFGGHHYRILFMIGSLLFMVTFLSNLAADIIIHHLKRRLEGKSR